MDDDISSARNFVLTHIFPPWLRQTSDDIEDLGNLQNQRLRNGIYVAANDLHQENMTMVSMCERYERWIRTAIPEFDAVLQYADADSAFDSYLRRVRKALSDTADEVSKYAESFRRKIKIYNKARTAEVNDAEAEMEKMDLAH